MADIDLKLYIGRKPYLGVDEKNPPALLELPEKNLDGTGASTNDTRIGIGRECFVCVEPRFFRKSKAEIDAVLQPYKDWVKKNVKERPKPDALKGETATSSSVTASKKATL